VNARNWPPLRRRTGRHGDRVDLTQAPAALELAAALPVPQSLLERPRPAAPVPVSREPVTEVTCGFCGVTGLSSAIPDVAGYGPRCTDTDACVRRWGNKEAATRLAGDAAPPGPGAHPYPAPEAEPVTEEPAPAAEPEPEPAAGEPAPATDATAVLLSMAKPEVQGEPAAPEATAVMPVTEEETQIVPAVEDEASHE